MVRRPGLASDLELNNFIILISLPREMASHAFLFCHRNIKDLFGVQSLYFA